MPDGLFHVRQYRPNYFSGFENEVVRDVPWDKILEVPWMENFRHEGFDRFTVEKYGTEWIIQAHYRDGAHWVAGFAIETTHPFAENWRYKKEDPADGE